MRRCLYHHDRSMSYPVTGSTGDGYGFAKSLGHEVTELKPSLIPFMTAEAWPHDLSGLSLKNVEGSLWRRGKKSTLILGKCCLHTLAFPGRLS